jgi:hypothetical protein
MYRYVRDTAVTPGCIADVLSVHHQVINVLPAVPGKFTVSLREMFTDIRDMFADIRSIPNSNRELSAYIKCTSVF